MSFHYKTITHYDEDPTNKNKAGRKGDASYLSVNEHS